MGRKKKSASTLTRNQKARNQLRSEHLAPKFEQYILNSDEECEADISNIHHENPKKNTNDKTKYKSRNQVQRSFENNERKRKCSTHISDIKNSYRKLNADHVIPSNPIILNDQPSANKISASTLSGTTRYSATTTTTSTELSTNKNSCSATKHAIEKTKTSSSTSCTTTRHSTTTSSDAARYSAIACSTTAQLSTKQKFPTTMLHSTKERKTRISSNENLCVKQSCWSTWYSAKSIDYKELYRNNMKDRLVNKYNTDEAYRLRTKTKMKKKYDIDDTYRIDTLNKCKNKYSSDVKYRTNTITRGKEKYSRDDFYRKNLISKQKHKYSTDDVYRTNLIAQGKQKYLTDDVYKKNLIAQGKQKYSTDDVYKKNLIAQGKQKYSTDDVYRKNLIAQGKKKYSTDDVYRRNLIAQGKKKYSTDDVYRRNLIAQGKQKYSTDDVYRKNLIAQGKQKYSTDDIYRKNLIAQGKQKYSTDAIYRTTMITRGKLKYASNDDYRVNLKNQLKHKYASNISHRIQCHLRKKIRYAINLTHRCRKITLAKKLYATNEMYKKNTLSRQKMTYKKIKKSETNKSTSKSPKQNKPSTAKRDIETLVNKFRRQICDGPDYICVCCHRMLYKESIQKFIPTKFTKVTKKLIETILKNKPETKNNSTNFLCKTCNNYLRIGKLPPQAAINGLLLHNIPEELSSLSELEAILVAQRIFFFKLLALPRGKQFGIHGSMVNVPANFERSVDVLPQPMNKIGLIPLKLKRKLEYKGHVYFQYIRPKLVKNALKWLKINNTLYSTIKTNDNWENDYEQMEPNVWNSLSHKNVPNTQTNSDNERETNSDIERESDRIQRNLKNNNNNPDVEPDSEESQTENSLEDKLSGLKYATCLQPIIPQYGDSNEILSVAPGEGNFPLDAMLDQNSEVLAYPQKFPFGRGGFTDSRNIKITLKKYTNQRILNCDKRFCSDVNYLFYAQFITEQKQIRDNILIAIRKLHGQVKAGDISSIEGMRQHIKQDQAYQFLKNVRGTPPYWQKTVKDLMAMVKQIGSPHFFLTLSAADMQWSELLKILSKHKGIELTDEAIAAMSYDDKCNLLREDPVLSARHFQFRLRKFFTTVLMTPCGPLGEIETYFYRIEFQMRGSPHAHCLIWIKDGPDVDKAPLDKLTEFFSKYIYVNIPENDEFLKDLVTKVQRHSHSVACSKNKKDTCRFHFPKPPSDYTIIAEPVPNCSIDPDDDSQTDSPQTILDYKTKILKPVYDALESNLYSPDITLPELLQKLNIDYEEYHKALSISIKARSYILKRKMSEKCINNYNPTILKAWQANMDLQPVLDTYACIMYVVSYLTKSERNMSELLKAAKKDFSNHDIKTQLKKIGTVFLTHREVSAQEAAYRLLGLPLVMCNVKRIFVASDLPEDRIRLLKPLKLLQELDPDSNEVYINGLPERYASRPNDLEKMCLADFAVNFDLVSNSNKETGTENDVLPPTETSKSQKRKRIRLKNGMGVMIQRKKRSIMRYHKFSKDKEPEKYFHSMLMLFMPWRNETKDLLDSFNTYSEAFTSKQDTVLNNKKKFEYFTDEVTDHIQQIVEGGIFPVSIWDSLAPEVQHQNEISAHERIIEDSNLQIFCPEDFDHNRQKSSQMLSTNSLPTEELFNTVSYSEFSKMVLSLNQEQRHVFQYVLDWCCKSLNNKIEPFYLFCTGGAGVGKSHLIHTILQMTNRSLRRPGDDPSQIVTHLSAPTGTAAYNIGGTTLHNSFLLPLTQSDKHTNLSGEKLSNLRNQFSKLKILIIDEISMVSSNMLCQIHERLQAITGLPPNIPFGGISILAVGDLQQLPPVGGRAIYNIPYGNNCDVFADLWNSHFSVIELTEIMRQKGDTNFASLLSRMRVGKVTSDDIELLKTRVITEDMDNNDSHLHLFPTNQQVDTYNNKLLYKLSTPMWTFKAIDKLPDKFPGITIPGSDIKAGGLPSILSLKEGCRVMLIRNVDVPHGLVNGAIGSITGFIQTSQQTVSQNCTPKAILVEFDDIKNQKWASQTFPSYNKSVPIELFEARFPITCGRGNKFVEATRLQFPLKVAYASTIHKCQGQTLDNVVISMHGRFGPGQAYVALSRCRSLQGLHILDFNASSIKTNTKSLKSVQQLSKENPFTKPHQLFLGDTGLRISSINCRSWNCHSQDAINDPYISNCQIAVFTETWLSVNFNVIIPHKSSIICAPSLPNHGGVMVSLSNDLKYKEILRLTSMDIQILALRIEMPQKSIFKELILVAVYRSPSSPYSSFVTTIHKHVNPLLSKADSNCPLIILGDFNVNLLDPKHRNPFLNCPQYVKDATHNSGSLLDHIYWTGNSALLKYEIIGSYWSDHSIVATHINYSDISHLSLSQNIINCETNIVPNTHDKLSSSVSFLNTGQHSPTETLRDIEHDITDRNENINLTSKYSSKPSIDIRLQRMSLTDDEDCFVTTNSSVPTCYTPAYICESSTSFQSKILHSACPVNVRLNRMSIPEDDDCNISYESVRLSRMSIAEDDECMISFTPMTYNNYDSLASHFDELMGTRTQLLLSLETSDFLSQLQLSKHNSPPDGHCLLHTWEVSTGTHIEIIKQSILEEFLNRRQFYESSLVTQVELEFYIKDNKYDLQSVDAVVNILSNAFKVTVFIIHNSHLFQTTVTKISPEGNISEKAIFILKSANHYDALIFKNS